MSYCQGCADHEARIAELELENTKWQDGHLARTVERDAARRELAQAMDALLTIDPYVPEADTIDGLWPLVDSAADTRKLVLDHPTMREGRSIRTAIDAARAALARGNETTKEES